jgi:uncharacterized protein
MHFAETKFKNAFFIKAYEDGQLFISDKIYTTPIIIFQDQLHLDVLPPHLNELALPHIKMLIEFKPELILLGTGAEQQFLEHALLAPLTQKRIGVEVMNTLSAARTFNLLHDEGRKVLGVFFP